MDGQKNKWLTEKSCPATLSDISWRHLSKTIITQWKKHHWGQATLRAFDSQGYALVCDGVVGSKQTHMGGYVEHRLAQSTNGRPIEEDAHTVKDSDLMLS